MGADFKYNNFIFKFQPKNTQIQHFWSQSIFASNFATRQIQGR